MIKIFQATDTSFLSNGDIVINPLLAKVHKEDNGDYYLDFEAGLENAGKGFIGDVRCNYINIPHVKKALLTALK